MKPGGRIGIVVPALREEIDGAEPPEHLAQWWEPDFWCFHTADWWRRHWTRSGAVEVETADWLDDGWQDWLLWVDVVAEESPQEFHRTMARWVRDMVRADAGRTFGFVRLVGRRK